MARFRIKDKHYLAVQGTEWEQVEVDMVSGKQVRKRYPVPLFLDPSDPTVHNYPGDIIVSMRADPAYPRDYVFDGKPTVDMEPLDDEARVEWEKVVKTGHHPIDSLPANGQTFSDSLLEKLTRQLDDLTTRNGPAPKEDRVSALEAQIAELRALLTDKAAPEKPKAALPHGAK